MMDIGLNQFPNNLESSKDQAVPDKTKANVTFVNYFPLSEALQKHERMEISTKQIEQEYEKKIKQVIKAFLDQEQQPLNIIPKKGNLDLKKFLNKRLEKLNKRTEKAIVKILRSKYNAENGIEEEKKDDKNTKGSAAADSKQAESQKDPEQTFKPLYNRNQTYDAEIYDEDDIIIEADNTNSSNLPHQAAAEHLIDAMATQEKLYQNLENDSQSDSD